MSLKIKMSKLLEPKRFYSAPLDLLAGFLGGLV